MFNYFDVNDAVKIRVDFACSKEELDALLTVRYSSRSVEHHLYRVLCCSKEDCTDKYHVYDFNATTHLLYNELVFDNCKDAMTYIVNKFV